jgi:thiol-disulfide isomerase/thioredoxin
VTERDSSGAAVADSGGQSTVQDEEMPTPPDSNDASDTVMDEARRELSANPLFPFDFTVTDLAGNEIKLSDLQGKVVIVDFWGTWCPPCRAEIPSFVKLQEQYGSQGLQIVGLTYEDPSNSAEDNTKTVQQFADSNGINYPCALGTDAITDQVPGFRAFPTTLFLDRTGKVRAKLEGLHEYDFLEALTLSLLDEENAAADPS